MDSTSRDFLGRLIASPSLLKREAVRRRKNFNEKIVSSDAVAKYIALGWQIDKNTKSKIKLKCEKEICERLKNKFWLFLFKLGYPELNENLDFSILADSKDEKAKRIPIDIFGKDDETIVIARCKASNQMVRKSLQKELEDFSNQKKSVSEAIHKHYGPSFKPKIIWLFVTENIIWSKPDKERANNLHVRVITERELRYYVQIADHLGKAARYQFLAEFLRNQEIPGLKGKKVPAIRGKLGGKTFFTFVTTPRHLLKIAFVNHRSLNDPDGAPAYQRLVNRSRLRDISSFITSGGYFPTNLLINFATQVRFDKIHYDDIADVTYGQLYLPCTYRSAWIIDGQHRLYGFSPAEDRFLDQNIIIVAFERMSQAEEANLFVTINHEQKSVPKHLLDDLEGELKWGSLVPSERIGAISARLVNQLNSDIGGPFYNRITQQGMTSTNKACLTIPALKDALRRSCLIGRAFFNNANYELGALCGTTDGETLDRARSALTDFFGIIRNANLTEWENGREGHLCTNVATQAYVMLMGALIKYWESNTASDSKKMPVEDMIIEIEEYIEPVVEFLKNNTGIAIKNAFSVPFGAGGPPEYYFRLCRFVRSKYSDFQPDGMEEWESEQSEERIQEADTRLKEIVTEMRHLIFGVFRKIYGEEKNAYWDKGVLDKNIKTEAYKRSLDYDVSERLPLEDYLEIIEMEKIIENKQNWVFFKDVFNIPEQGEKGLAKNLKWMDRINELRRISAHPAKERHYKIDDFEYIDFIYNEFMARIGNAKKTPQDFSNKENGENA